MAGYIFGGNTGETPESIARKRAIAAALLKGNNRQPDNVGEAVGQGLNGLGNALVYRALMGEADRGETAGRQSADTDFAPLLSGGASPVANALMSPGAKTAGIPMPDAAGEVAATSPNTDVSKNGSTFEPFIDTVKAGGLTNPHGLAAVAATGRSESGWSPDKAAGSWADPSESGQAGTSGGVMSWRAERLQNLRSYASSKGEGGNGSPQTQAEFFMREDPTLIARLNEAKSPEEAAGMMANAWKFAGYDRPGGENARRMTLASSYLPRFQDTQVASLDPSAGIGAPYQPTIAQPDPTQATQVDAAQGQMNGGAVAIESIAPSAGYRDPMVSAPNGRGAVANALMSPTPQPAAGSSVVAALANPSQSAAPAKLSPVAAALMSPRPETQQQPHQVAQADAGYFPAAPNPVGQSGPSMQQIMRVLNNPNATEAQRAYAASLLERQQKMADPAYKLDMETKQAQLDALRGKPTKTWQKLDDTTLFNPETGETQRVNAPAAGAGQFRFEGKSVEAQALNGLMEAGQLSPDQAQQLGAGKTITGPNGEIIFMTPQGVFGKTSQDAPAMPLSAPGAAPQPASVDIFGDVPDRSATPAANAPQAPSVPAQRSGMIPLTEPKVTIDESKAGGFADRMTQSGALVDQFGNAGLSTFDQTITNSPYVPSVIANNLVGDDFQKYDQARRDFINAQLRRESGAVISPEEFDNANRQYFPQPGDKTEVIEQKRKNRETVIGAMIRDAGPTYKKPATAASGAPEKGTVEGGYHFKGGDPADQSNWEKVQ